ncbi:DUF1697 domain-containing protein [soil metagenome]
MVKMAELKKMLESMGFENVRTLLNSGNVVFDATQRNINDIRKNIEKELEAIFGFPIDTIIRKMIEIEKLIDADPFKGIEVTSQTRLYVTFLSDIPTSTLKIPYESPGGDYKILNVSNNEIISFLTLSPTNKTVDAMNILEKEFGKKITTRNWNTVKKIVALK